MYGVVVVFTNGAKREFKADSSYDSSCDGRMLVWDGVLIDGKSVDYYSVPIDKVEEITERDLGK